MLNYSVAELRRTKVKLPGLNLQQKPTVIEQFAYADTSPECVIS